MMTGAAASVPRLIFRGGQTLLVTAKTADDLLSLLDDVRNADSLLRQLFYNLIDNTRKYGGKATMARLYCEKAESDELLLVYEDDGAGISAENKLKLFTEGFSTGGSTGFGLFLIRRMMDVYGWQIQETGEPGKGAKFVITIPKTNPNGKENYQLP